MRIGQKTKKIIEKQFTLDCNLSEAEEIKKGEIFLAPSKKLQGARIVNKTDLFFRAISYDGKVFLMADESIYEGCKEVFKDRQAEWFFEFSNLRLVDKILESSGYEIADTHIYFLPDEDFPDIEENRPVVWYDSRKISQRKEKTQTPHALGYSPTQPDILAVAAVRENRNHELEEMGIAGASLDGLYTRQIGLDIKPEYRGTGLGTYLTTLIKQKITACAGKQGQELVPFYGTNESHSISRRVAVEAGFLPAWSEIYVKKKS